MCSNTLSTYVGGRDPSSGSKHLPSAPSSQLLINPFRNIVSIKEHNVPFTYFL